MAPEKKDKKRKATTAAAVTPTELPNKKSKKVSATDKTPLDAPKSILKQKDTLKEKTNGVAKAPAPASSEPARKVKPRKRASDFLSDDDDDHEEKLVNEEEKKSTPKQPSKKNTDKVAKKAKKGDSSKMEKPEPEAQDEVGDEAEESEDQAEDSSDENDNEIDDQTAELIKGFESSGDEDASEDEGYDGKTVPRIPDSKKAKRKIQKKLKESNHKDEPGTVYVGRIPHGFYEHQMRAYFSQFGDITRLRISRNKVTGRSKHYAFIEFASSVVAKIVAETMNNYLMYGHILKCKFMPQEQVHAELWKGANRRYKRVPWNRIEKQRLERGKTREKWTRSIQREGSRRLSKAEKLKELLGYEYEVPSLKAIDTVPVQEKLPAPEAEAEAEKDLSVKETTTAIGVNGEEKKDAETQAVAEETPKKKAKKAKTAKQPTTPEVKSTPAKSVEEKQATPSATPEISTKKAKKAKKLAGKA